MQAIIIELKAFPASGRQKILLDKTGIVKVYLKSPAERGKANKELIKFLADILDISTDKIEILSGELSQKKRLRFNLELTKEQLFSKLGLDNQIKLV